jgi:hypothetical protein
MGTVDNTTIDFRFRRGIAFGCLHTNRSTYEVIHSIAVVD